MVWAMPPGEMHRMGKQKKTELFGFLFSDAYENAKFLCEQYYLVAPDLHVECRNGKLLRPDSGIPLQLVLEITLSKAKWNP